MPTVEQLETLLTSTPDDPFLMYGLALEHAKAGRHNDAIDWFDRSLAVDPASCYAYYHKARSLESLDRFEQAAATLRAGIEQAQAQHDAHAESELTAFLEEFA